MLRYSTRAPLQSFTDSKPKWMMNNEPLRIDMNDKGKLLLTLNGSWGHCIFFCRFLETKATSFREYLRPMYLLQFRLGHGSRGWFSTLADTYSVGLEYHQRPNFNKFLFIPGSAARNVDCFKRPSPQVRMLVVDARQRHI